MGSNTRRVFDMPLESSIVSGIMKAVKALGCDVEKTHGGQYGTAGRADLYVLVPTEFSQYPVPLYIECKQPGKHMTPLQIAWANKKRRVGALVMEAHDVDEVINVINDILSGRPDVLAGRL